MSDCCDSSHQGLDSATTDTSWILRAQKVLWFALIVNLGMFVVEMLYSFRAASLSLRADALDFLSDSASYIITLFVLHRPLKIRNRAALIKALGMGSLGIWILFEAVMRIYSDKIPDAPTMGWIGAAALVANIVVAAVLYQFRRIDANMESVWLCSRNDAISNLAVLMAALGVWTSASFWPDLIVGTVIAALSLTAAFQVLKRLKNGEPESHAGHGH